VTRSMPNTASKLISSGKLTCDERIVVYCAVAAPTPSGLFPTEDISHAIVIGVFWEQAGGRGAAALLELLTLGAIAHHDLWRKGSTRALETHIGIVCE